MTLAKIAVAGWLALGAVTLRPADDAVNRRTSERLVDLFNLEPRVRDITEALLQLELQKDPDVANFADIYRQYFADVLAWEKLKPELAGMFQREFTADELQQLVTFFDSEIGRKYMTVSMTLPAKVAVITDKLLRTKTDDLHKRLKQRRAELIQRETDKLDEL